VPSEAGKKLMESGAFGTTERLRGTFGRKRKLAYRNMMRELGVVVTVLRRVPVSSYLRP
jgi:WD repeat-containing protein 23